MEKSGVNKDQIFLSGTDGNIFNNKPLLSRISISLNYNFDLNTDSCKILGASFIYDVNLDWITPLPFGEHASNQSYKDKVIAIDTIGSKFDIYAIGNPSTYKSAWVAALDYNGNLKWQKEYYGVKGKIQFNSLLVDGEHLIVGGSTGFEHIKDNDFRRFGYIGLFDKMTGNIISQKKYGIADKDLTVSAIRKQGNYIKAWGIQDISNGWSFKIKKSNL